MSATRTSIEPEAKRRVGRPSERSQELADDLCDWLSDGKSLRSYCEQPGKKSKPFFLTWLNDDAEFLTRYARAKREAAAFRAEEILEIADEEPREIVGEDGTARIDPGWIAHQKNRIDARKWIASKDHSARYGDTQAAVNVNVGVQINQRESVDELRARIAARGKVMEGEGDLPVIEG